MPIFIIKVIGYGIGQAIAVYVLKVNWFDAWIIQGLTIPIALIPLKKKPE